MDTKSPSDMTTRFTSFPSVSLFRRTSAGLKVMEEPDLDDLIPLTRPGLSSDMSLGIKYRDYFQAIQRVVRDHWPEIVDAVVEAATPYRADIREVRIVGEKHGSDYHPARVAVVSADRTHSFVMNVALTSRGTERITQEFSVLRLLSARPGERFVPRVYFLTEQGVESEADPAIGSGMFLGEWLDEFHEFHLTAGSADAPYDTVLWDVDRGRRLLRPASAWEIFRQVAFILTWYYDPTTFREIYPWHHAAGDFVARVKDGTVSVKLIATRQYGSRIVFPTAETIDPLDGLLAFFANLTVRNRLDRLDGVGQVVFAGGDCVEATVHGFFDALRAKASGGWCPSELPERFVRLAGALSPADWAEVFGNVVHSYDPDAPDMPAIMEFLTDHIFQVYRLAQWLG